MHVHGKIHLNTYKYFSLRSLVLWTVHFFQKARLQTWNGLIGCLHILIYKVPCLIYVYSQVLKIRNLRDFILIFLLASRQNVLFLLFTQGSTEEKYFHSYCPSPSEFNLTKLEWSFFQWETKTKINPNLIPWF